MSRVRIRVKKMLEAQKELQEMIPQVRERNKIDIKMSFLAELIECNEESKTSHKTWKKKEYDRAKHLEEYVDCFFFYFELLNKEKNFVVTSRLEEVFKDFDSLVFNKYTVVPSIILYLHEDDLMGLFMCLCALGDCYGFTNDEVEEMFYKKLEKNKKRIGKEWNIND